MTKNIKKPSLGRSPVSVRLTSEERALLERDANGMSLSRYIRIKLFQADESGPVARVDERLSAAARQKLLAQILASLGKSGMPAALSELTKLARLALIPNDANLVVTLTQARDEIIKLRLDLLRGLGMRPKSGGQK